MRSHVVISALVLLAMGGCVSTGQPGSQSSDRATITAAEEEWGAAFASGDASVSERLLADDFVGTDTRGARYDKAQMVREVRAGPPLASDVTVVEDIRFEGPVAIVSGHDDIVPGKAGAAPRTNVWTDLWAKRRGRWVLISAQDTNLPKPSS